MSGFEIKRRRTRKVKIGSFFIGGESPITVQTMTNTKTSDVEATLRQAKRLQEIGAEIIRVSIPDQESVHSIKKLKSELSSAIVADIHFRWKLAVASLEAGADKVRINPGTIGSEKNVLNIINCAKEFERPIRIGLNAASLPKRFRLKSKEKGLLKAADYWIKFFEDADFFNMVISAKSSSPTETIDVYRELSERYDYPLHLGVTEAGPLISGTVRSVSALSILLSEGIGDTIRISLSADPEAEVRAGVELLKALGLRSGPVLISCPTCSRAKVDVIKLANMVEETLLPIKIPITVAVMGCAVNGPGEAREADIGIAGSGKDFKFFKKGKVIRTIKAEEAINELLKEIKDLIIKSEGQVEAK